MEKVVSSDVSKEVIMVLSFCENSFIDKIPDYVLKNLNDLAANSNKEFYIKKDKSLNEQDLSDGCKDLISELYFMYVLNSDSKRELLNEILTDVDKI